MLDRPRLAILVVVLLALLPALAVSGVLDDVDRLLALGAGAEAEGPEFKALVAGTPIVSDEPHAAVSRLRPPELAGRLDQQLSRSPLRLRAPPALLPLAV